MKNSNNITFVLLAGLLLLITACTTQDSSPAQSDDNLTNVTLSEKYVAMGDQCDVVRFVCAQGKEYFRDDAGCGCQDVAPPLEDRSYTYDYLFTDAAQCKDVLFKCKADDEAFFNENGCGCKTPKVNDGSEFPLQGSYCKDSERNAEICTLEYAPTCGWFDSSKIQCIKFPCAQEYSNRCGACANADVEYVTQGACPTEAPQDIKLVEFNEPVSCSDAQMAAQGEAVACTREYRPVCGADAADGLNTYSNPCTACATPGVYEYTEGACEATSTMQEAQ